MQHTARRGFTLIEMSLVLVVIGTIIGGVIYGKSLIVSSKLQTVITDADNYASAVVNFKQTYQALPGDFATATTPWGTDSVSCPTGGGPTGTCNGNGDGKIGAVSTYEYEVFRFWQQLNDAGMSTKSLSGVAGSAGVYDSTVGTNVPQGPLKGSGFSAVWYGTVVDSSSVYCTNAHCFTGFYGNVLQFGSAISADITRGPILTAEQANVIDAKMDDGKPASGKVRAFISSSAVDPGCTTTDVAATSVYSVSTAGVLCSLTFVMGF